MSVNFHDGERDIERISREIADYLSERDHVADTLAGIVQWWIVRQRLTESEDKVKRAVEHLCDRGLIKRRELRDGTVLYSSVGNGPARSG